MINYANGMSFSKEDIIRMVNEEKKVLTFRHFKGSTYVSDMIATDSEDHEKLRMIYHNFNHPEKKWDRELDMFLSEVDHEKYPDVTQKMRFELIKVEED